MLIKLHEVPAWLLLLSYYRSWFQPQEDNTVTLIFIIITITLLLYFRFYVKHILQLNVQLTK